MPTRETRRPLRLPHDRTEKERAIVAIIDTHFHLWDPGARDHAWLKGAPALNRKFDIQEFEAVAGDNGISEAVLVQVLNDTDDTLDFLATAAAHSIVAGVVGWVELESSSVHEQIAALRASPGGNRLVSIRHLIQDEPDGTYAARSSVIAGVRAVGDAGLAYDLLVRSHQLPAAISLARAVPDCRVVLDHGAKPPLLGTSSLETWERLVAELSRLENVSCKLSGLVTEGGEGWRGSNIQHCLRYLLECFGLDRVMFGSDWPVCTAVARYDEVLELCESVLSGLSAFEQDAVLSENARRIYRLGGGNAS